MKYSGWALFSCCSSYADIFNGCLSIAGIRPVHIAPFQSPLSLSLSTIYDTMSCTLPIWPWLMLPPQPQSAKRLMKHARSTSIHDIFVTNSCSGALFIEFSLEFCTSCAANVCLANANITPSPNADIRVKGMEWKAMYVGRICTYNAVYLIPRFAFKSHNRSTHTYTNLTRNQNFTQKCH